MRFTLSIILLCLGLALPLRGQAPPLAWQMLPEALAEAATSNRPALVYVRAAWCSPCHRLERETFADSLVVRRLGRFARAKLTFDDADRTHRLGGYRRSEAEWSAHLGATSTPTLILLAPDGALLARHPGFLPPEGLLTLLDAALQAHTNTHLPR